MKKIRTASGKIQIGFKGIAANTDEKIADPSYAERAYNFTFRDGVLKSDIGVVKAKGYSATSASDIARWEYPSLEGGAAILKIFPYHRRTDGAYDDRLVVLTNDKRLNYIKIFGSGDEWHKIEEMQFTGDVCAVNYNYDGKDVLLVSSENNSLVMLDGNDIKSIDGAPKFTSLAVHYERVYGTVNEDKNQVWFSSVMNPENWTVSGEDAGYITFADENGDVEKVTSLGGNLYIFREHAVYRLTAYAEQSEFLLKKVFTDTGRIYKDTIAFAGDKIMFYSEDGLFAFDGYDAVRISDFLKVEKAANAIGTYHDNKYYLACRLDLGNYFSSTIKNNAIIEYDTNTKKSCVLAPLDVAAMTAVNVHHATDVLIATRGLNIGIVGMIDKSSEIFGTSSLKVYKSPTSTFGTSKMKVVRAVDIMTAGNIYLYVTADGVTNTYAVEGSEFLQRVPIEMSGYVINFEIITRENADIAPFTAEVDYF